MSILNTFGRPCEYFDVTNSQHRQLFAEFQKTGSWKHSPVRLLAREEGENIPVIQRQLVEFYLNREFGKIAA